MSSRSCGIGSSSCSSLNREKAGKLSFETSVGGRSNASCRWEQSETPMDRQRLTYTPLPDTTAERERDALAAIYAFVIERHTSRQAADATGDRNEVKEDDVVDPIGSLF